MKLVEIISKGKDGRYMLVEPACNAGSDAYPRWVGLTIEKVMDAIVVVKPQGTKYNYGDFLELNGLVIKSEWTYLREGELYGES